ncbi:hypothetical protein G8O24_29955 [Bradyrhizobium sp. INPA01-394B]|uniref:Uncharacterized protein n=1 Tax=Bradyrhizobium campsiandrae TaxID=1729892 RepID=A0ABR7UGC3_9BRAD|nr:hypothetical protein [Bradyrhizobium campsiandrae]MBC9881553.1 hypothetical protein [Bradyrhizobium campsiandrae]MBC9982529.1 hypothetical protein [Bradyrhizobium campsiandrae]
MIDSKEASAALADIDDIVQRVRQSRIYDLASRIIILWGVLMFVANIATWLAPRGAYYFWLADVLGIAGSFAISAVNQASTGVRSFDLRMLLAFLMFIAFGFFCAHVLGHFTPREQGTFWTIYVMLFYAVAGLWFGTAFVVIALAITALTLTGYFFVTGDAFLPWMAVVNGIGLVVGGLWMRRS